MSDNIAIELSKLSPQATIELFELDTRAIDFRTVPDSEKRIYLHAGVNELKSPVVWQGIEYLPFPVEFSGFSAAAQGPLPRPTMKVSNVMGLIGSLVLSVNGLRGAKIIRKRTLVKYLDAVNFEGGVNPSADPTAHYVDEIWLIDRTARRDKYLIEFELASPIDVMGSTLPRRQVLALTCVWEYRGPDCGYSGGPVADSSDNPTTDPLLDDCSHCLRGCRMRQWPNNELSFSGFPGAGAIRQV